MVDNHDSNPQRSTTYLHQFRMDAHTDVRAPERGGQAVV